MSLLKKAGLHRQRKVLGAAGSGLAGIALGIFFSVFSLRVLAVSGSPAWLLPTAGSVAVLWLGFDLCYRLLAAAGRKQCAAKQKSRRNC